MIAASNEDLFIHLAKKEFFVALVHGLTNHWLARLMTERILSGTAEANTRQH